MTRSRNRLHVDKLNDFALFCMERGWVPEEINEDYEVLRMRHRMRAFPLIVHGKLTTNNGAPLVHYTAWGESGRMLDLFLKENNNG